MTSPTVTIVISFRERWRFTPLTVESILTHTSGKFALWLLDSGMPGDVRDAVQQHVKGGKLRIVHVGQGQQPNAVRAAIASQIDTQYAVFIDNDVVVMSGWLDRMVGCAEETGAGIICPLYLWGEDKETDRIHVAGGDLDLVPAEQGVRMIESHRHVNRRISDVPDDLHRRTCGYGEFHCLMMRREVYSDDGIFDPGIVTVHEHIHASLRARELGFETWFEPEARVNYLAFAPWQVGELNDLRKRWDLPTADRSLDEFARRWNIVDDEDYRVPMHRFLALHASHTDVLDPRPALAARRDEVMTRGDLQQTFGGIEWLAHNSGYDRKDIGLLRRGYRLAMSLLRGLYRPCGRPFINHLAGTASVLLFYGCPMPHVIAALLHAAHTHGPRDLVPQRLRDFTKFGPNAETAVEIVDRYGERSRLLRQLDDDKCDFADLPLELASLCLLDAANDVDMHLSFEVAVTGRADLLSGVRLEQTQRLLKYVGLPGLAETLQAVNAEEVAMPDIPFEAGLNISFRLPPQRPIGAGGRAQRLGGTPQPSLGQGQDS